LLHDNSALQFELLLKLFVLSLLLADDAIALDELLLSLLKLLLHLLDLRFVNRVGVSQLGRLFFQRRNHSLGLFNDLLLVLDLPRKRLVKHHLLGDGPLLREFGCIESFVA
jgi:hypothetical protein